MKHKQMSLETAFKEVKSRRCVARPNLNFMAQLSQFEVSLYGEAKRTPWTSYTMNGISREVPEFIITTCLSHYTFEFVAERSKKE